MRYSLLILCADVKYKMYKPPLLLQFEIRRWSYSRVEVQELESSKKCSLSHILRVIEDSVVMGARKNRVRERVSGTFYCEKQRKLLITWATSVFYFLGLIWAKRITWTAKIFHGQPNQAINGDFKMDMLQVKIKFLILFVF